MQDTTFRKTRIQSGDGHLEQLVERGRQLHDHAVFDLFAWMVSIPVSSARQFFGNDLVKKEGNNFSNRLSIKHNPLVHS
jgi:hypothetical protein